MIMIGHTLHTESFYFIGDVGFTHSPLNTMGKAYGGMYAENQIARDSLHDVVLDILTNELIRHIQKWAISF